MPHQRRRGLASGYRQRRASQGLRFVSFTMEPHSSYLGIEGGTWPRSRGISGSVVPAQSCRQPIRCRQQAVRGSHHPFVYCIIDGEIGPRDTDKVGLRRACLLSLHGGATQLLAATTAPSSSGGRIASFVCLLRHRRRDRTTEYRQGGAPSRLRNAVGSDSDAVVRR